ncbi:MAG: phytoene/squalene synthase family protein [Planctomycetes bacterium]|nr:phytoene/squalene synthase family protein [Planctomycetota bacterium]
MPDLEDAYAHSHSVVADRAKNFLYAFKLLPADRRRALEAIYAYCRLADDFADDEGIDPAERTRLLADLRRKLARACGAPDPGGDAPLAPDGAVDLLMLALGDAVRRYGVAYADLDEVAQGCEQDLVKRRYETFAELHAYCYQVASAVGLACLDVFGYTGDRESARALAEDLGIAMQLTNIVRDVREDFERDRVYLPQEDLRRFGVSEPELAEGAMTPGMKALIEFQVARAEDYFSRGAQLAPRVLRASRVCPLALAGIYRALLREIERRDYDVFSERVSLGSGRKLALMLWSMGRALTLRGAS